LYLLIKQNHIKHFLKVFTKLKPVELKKLLSKQANLAINSNKNPFVAKYKNKEINICIGFKNFIRTLSSSA
jgi:hypothetical protein